MPRERLPKDAFFEAMGHTALTFDDVRLHSGYAEVMPDDVSLATKFSRNVPLKTPLVSAAMDTVTEHQMAIVVAKFGGLGVIHRNLTAEAQAKEVSRVKFHLNAFIREPICMYEQQTIEEILRIRDEKKYSFHTFPILDLEGKLAGVLSENDFEMCTNKSLQAKQVMSTQLITAAPNTTVQEAYTIMMKGKKKVLPLVNAERKLIGLYIFSDVQRIVTESSSLYNTDDNGQLRVGAAIGVHDYERLEKLLNRKVDVVVIDTAHGDSKPVMETLREIKKKHQELDVVAGNISQPDSARRLIEAGADGIKVGQGPGSICTTRIVAGVGRPQVTAVYACAKIADEYGIPVCADGGIRHSADIAIALGVGAHSVMLGNMLAATDEASGKITHDKEGRSWKVYRGMGSLVAMQEHAASRERYSTGKSDVVAEGVEALVRCKGSVMQVLVANIKGLKRGMGYVGAASIEELRRKANFDQLTLAGKIESHPHDLEIIREPPNYQRE